MDTKSTAIVAASLAGAYVVFDSLNTMGRPGIEGQSAFDYLAGLARDFTHIRPSGQRGVFVQHLKTNLPVLNSSGVIVPGLPSTNNWHAIQRMAVDIVQGGQGTGAVVAALASVEVQHGNLTIQCDNCNLFSIRPEGDQPFFVRGNGYLQSFIANNDEIEGYRQCLTRFRDMMGRPGYQDAIAMCVSDNPDGLQRILGAAGWAPEYASDTPYIRNRLARLQSLGLIRA